MRRWPALLSALLALLLLPCAVHASGNDVETPYREMRLAVWTPRHVTLRASQLHVLSTAGRLPVVRLQSPSAPTFIFVALDFSSDPNASRIARGALQRWTVHLPRNQYVGLVSLDGGLRFIQEPTRDGPRLEREINAISLANRPGLLTQLPKLETFVSRLERRGNIRAAILCVTDSNVYSYRAGYGAPTINGSDQNDLSRVFAGRDLQIKTDQVNQQLLRAQAPLFIVHVAPGNDALNLQYRAGLTQFAQATGGDSWFADNWDQIVPQLELAITRMDTFSLAVVRAPRSSRPLRLSYSLAGAPLPGRLRAVNDAGGTK